MPDASTKGYRPLHLTSAAEAPHRRAEMAREIFGRQILRLDVDPLPDMDFHIDLKLLNLPGVKVLSGSSSGMATPRTPMLLSDGSDDIFVTLSLGGRMLCEQRGQEIMLQRGGLHIASCAERMTYVHLDSRSRGLLAPRAAIAALVPDLEDRIGKPLANTAHGFHLLAHYAAHLNAVAGVQDTNLAALAATHIHDLIALTVGAGREARELAAGRGLKAARLLAIKAYVNGRLTADLSAKAIALAHGLTPRYIQRLFEEDGVTLSAYVRGQRLARAHDALSHPGGGGRSISMIAYDCGFSDISHFNHAFRDHYGVTPSDVRRLSAGWTAQIER